MRLTFMPGDVFSYHSRYSLISEPSRANPGVVLETNSERVWETYVAIHTGVWGNAPLAITNDFTSDLFIGYIDGNITYYNQRDCKLVQE